RGMKNMGNQRRLTSRGSAHGIPQFHRHTWSVRLSTHSHPTSAVPLAASAIVAADMSSPNKLQRQRRVDSTLHRFQMLESGLGGVSGCSGTDLSVSTGVSESTESASSGRMADGRSSTMALANTAPKK